VAGENHDKADEIQVGFYKKASGKPSITYSEAVEQALCFGWIDSVRKGVDDISYMNRFTPRRPGSTWSAVNIKKVKELKRRGLMHPAGLAAFEKRADDRTAIYSYEQRKTATLGAAYERQLRANKAAWNFFRNQPPSYQRAAAWWVISAKKEETRKRRLARLIEDSERGRTISPLTSPSRAK
jgi:uncharacterized protein YdeI (YjbR/CyaY-like superfamily)